MARSMTSGGPCEPEGTPSAMGLVPNTASEEPCGATYSGDWHMTSPTRPCCAMCSTQYLHAPQPPLA